MRSLTQRGATFASRHPRIENLGTANESEATGTGNTLGKQLKPPDDLLLDSVWNLMVALDFVRGQNVSC